MKNAKLIDHLLQSGLVNRTQLRELLLQQKPNDWWIEKLLSFEGVNELKLAHTLGAFYKLKVIDITRITPKDQALGMLSPHNCRDHLALPFSIDRQGALMIAVADPGRVKKFIPQLRKELRRDIQAFVAPITSLRAAIKSYSGVHKTLSIPAFVPPPPEEMASFGNQAATVLANSGFEAEPPTRTRSQMPSPHQQSTLHAPNERASAPPQGRVRARNNRGGESPLSPQREYRAENTFDSTRYSSYEATSEAETEAFDEFFSGARRGEEINQNSGLRRSNERGGSGLRSLGELGGSLSGVMKSGDLGGGFSGVHRGPTPKPRNTRSNVLKTTEASPPLSPSGVRRTPESGGRMVGARKGKSALISRRSDSPISDISPLTQPTDRNARDEMTQDLERLREDIAQGEIERASLKMELEAFRHSMQRIERSLQLEVDLLRNIIQMLVEEGVIDREQYQV